MAGPTNVADLISSVTSVGRSAQSTAAQISALLTSQSDAMIQGIGLADTAAADASTVAMTEGVARLQSQKQALQAATLLGTNMQDVASERITGLTRTMREEYDQAAVAREDLLKRRGNTFFNDPMQWIGDNVLGGLEQSVAKYDLHAMKYNAAEENLTKITQLTTESATAARAIEQKLSESSVGAAARIAAYQFNTDALKYESASLGADVEALKAIQAGDTAAMEARLKVWGIEKDEQQLKLARESASRQQQQLNIFMAEHKEKAEAKKSMENVIRAGMSVYGLPTDKAENISRLAILYNTPEGKKQLSELIDAGYRRLTTGEVVMGRTPAEAFDAIRKINPGYTEDQMFAPGIKYIVDVQGKVALNKLIDPKNKEAVAAALNQVVATDVRVWTTDAEAKGSLYSDTGLKATIEAGKDVLTNTALYQKVLGPQMLAGVDKISAAEMIGRVTAAIKAKEITQAEASKGLQQYYKTVVYSNAVRNHALGIPPQASYTVSVGSGIFGGESYDLSKPEQVTAALLAKSIAGTRESRISVSRDRNMLKNVSATNVSEE